jgi:alkylation response protein AidB-like acyl-CoA dehydrogenase
VTLLSHHDDAEFALRYGLTDEETAWRVRAREFAEGRLAPIAREADRAGRFDRETARSLGAAGLLSATFPESEGGGGASTLAGCLIAEEIGAVDGSARGFLAVQIGLVAHTLATYATEDQRATWLPRLLTGEAIGCYALTEEGAGSDAGAIATRARVDGDSVVLDGEKVWITNGGVADVALVFVTTDPAKRHRGLECYVVPTSTPGLETAPMPGRELGHRASDHARLTLRGVRVARVERLGEAGHGFSIAMHALEGGRLNVAAGAVGIHRACLDACVSFARSRRQFGRRIGDFQQIGAELAEMAVDLEASRLLTFQAARLRDRGLGDAAAVSAAKLRATENALKAATTALKMHGSRGYTDELPLERHYRDVVALTIYEGTSHIQRLILGRGLLGKDEGAPA